MFFQKRAFNYPSESRENEGYFVRMNINRPLLLLLIKRTRMIAFARAIKSLAFCAVGARSFFFNGVEKMWFMYIFLVECE